MSKELTPTQAELKTKIETILLKNLPEEEDSSLTDEKNSVSGTMSNLDNINSFLLKPSIKFCFKVL